MEQLKETKMSDLSDFDEKPYDGELKNHLNIEVDKKLSSSDSSSNTSSGDQVNSDGNRNLSFFLLSIFWTNQGVNKWTEDSLWFS